jgi:hypothetical protein
MTRVFTTGFEEADQFALWDTMSGMVDYGNIVMSRFPMTYQDMEPRTGRGMMALHGSHKIYKDFDALDDIYLGVAVYTGAMADIRWLEIYCDSPGAYSNYMSVRVGSDGAIDLQRTTTVVASSAVGALTLNTWHYIEVYFHPDNSAGEITLKVDGTQVVTFSGDTTNDLSVVSGFSLSGMNNTSYAWTRYDDLVANSGAGSFNNTWPGQVRLLPIRPESPGNYAQWDRGGVDLGSNEAAVRQAYDFAVRQTSTADEYDTFDPDVPDLPVGATIANIIVCVKGKVEAGSGVVAPMVRANGTDDIGSDFTLGVGYLWAQEVWPQNPDDTAAWAEADLALLEIGYSS